MCKEEKAALVKAINGAVRSLGYSKDIADAIVRELKHSEDKGSLSATTLHGLPAYGFDAAGLIAGALGISRDEVWAYAKEDQGMSLDRAWKALGWGLNAKFGDPKPVQPITQSQVVAAITSLGIDPDQVHTITLTAECVSVAYYDLRDGRRYYREGEEATQKYAKTVAVFPVTPDL